MIEFRTLADDHPDLAHSPLLRAALLTLQYAREHGSIGLTQTKAFKRVFVHWAVEHFDWPGQSAEEVFSISKVVNEYEFAPLDVLHYLLITLRLGRHFKGQFRLTKRGAELAQAPGRLFLELIPFYVFQLDHAHHAGFDQRLLGNWDIWMNVINAEADHGARRAGARRGVLWESPCLSPRGMAGSLCVLRRNHAPACLGRAAGADSV